MSATEFPKDFGNNAKEGVPSFTKEEQEILNKYDLFSFQIIQIPTSDVSALESVISKIDEGHGTDDGGDGEMDGRSCDCCEQATELGLQDFREYINAATCDEGGYDFEGDGTEFIDCQSKYETVLDDVDELPQGIYNKKSDSSDGMIKKSDTEAVEDALNNQNVDFDKLDGTPVQKYLVNGEPLANDESEAA